MTVVGDAARCTNCSAAYVKIMDNLERRLRRNEEKQNIPLPDNAPLSLCSAGRLQSTVMHNRKRFNPLTLLN